MTKVLLHKKEEGLIKLYVSRFLSKYISENPYREHL